MRTVRVMNATRGAVLGTRVRVADRWWQRLRGLLGTDRLGEGEGMLIHPCASVHTLGMRFALDVAFLERDGRVVALYPALPPNRGTRWTRGARFALELREGGLQDTRVGDRLEWSDAVG
jgi:uncharacterized membrane protein (UPF0127 family)